MYILSDFQLVDLKGEEKKSMHTNWEEGGGVQSTGWSEYIA